MLFVTSSCPSSWVLLALTGTLALCDLECDIPEVQVSSPLPSYCSCTVWQPTHAEKSVTGLPSRLVFPGNISPELRHYLADGLLGGPIDSSSTLCHRQNSFTRLCRSCLGKRRQYSSYMSSNFRSIPNCPKTLQLKTTTICYVPSSMGQGRRQR